jgi:hypothetical protein
MEALAFGVIARSHGLGTRAKCCFYIQKPSLLESDGFEEQFTFGPDKVVPVFSQQSLDSQETFFLDRLIEKLLSRCFLGQNVIVEYTVAMYPKSPCRLKEFQDK